jgi:hypothetical protein
MLRQKISVSTSALRAWVVASFGALVVVSPGYAEVNKCVDSTGRVTYTDRPCAPSSSSPSTSAAKPAAAVREPKRVEVAPPPPVDLSAFPKDAQGRRTLFRDGDAAVVLEKGKPSPVNILAACGSMVTHCYKPGERELDDCFFSAPRCTSARPWENPDLKPCCPEACWRQYDALRKAGVSPIRAFDTVLFGTGSDEQSCLPLR